MVSGLQLSCLCLSMCVQSPIVMFSLAFESFADESCCEESDGGSESTATLSGSDDGRGQLVTTDDYCSGDDAVGGGGGGPSIDLPLSSHCFFT